MTVSELIHPGDKIDIRLIQQMENEEKTGSIAQRYRSQVLDIKENGNIEIAMPTEGGRLILLPLGVRFEFIFFSNSSLYRCVAQIRERYKKDNIYMLEAELKSQLEKFQRREYYRCACTIDFTFFNLTSEQASLDTVEKIILSLKEERFLSRQLRGTVVDLSGGGTRFRSEYQLENGQNILLGLRLKNDNMDKQYYILGVVIGCSPTEKAKGKLFETRVKFMIKDNRIREEIIRYIFEEERRIRQKENG